MGEFCEGIMAPQLASEPFGNVWLLRKVLIGAWEWQCPQGSCGTAFWSGGWVPAGARLCLGDPVPLWLRQLQAQSLTSKRAWHSRTLIPALQDAVVEAERAVSGL